MAHHTTIHTRQVKLHAKSRCISSSLLWQSRIIEVPWLNVSGRWLEEAGFRIGDPVVITVNKGKLIIVHRHDPEA